MCGRFALSLTPGQFQDIFGVVAPDGYEPRWNITPDSLVVIVRDREGGERRAGLARWGMLGPWMKEANDPGRQINARVETAADKPMFRDAFKRGRCLVPADGFYEWQKQVSGPSRPFFINRGDGSSIAFAGLWRWTRLPDGSGLATCTILTTKAHGNIAALHHRMPVILRPEMYDAWLDPAVTDPAFLREVLEPLSEDAMAFHEIGRAVNNPRNEGPALVEPLQAPPEPPAQGMLL